MTVHKDLVWKTTEQIRQIVLEAIAKAAQEGTLPEGDLPSVDVEIPADTTHGDFSSNVAMANAKTFRLAPRKIAEEIVSHLDFTDTYFDRAEIAGPGFLNFFLRPEWFADVLLTISELGEAYGRTNYGKGKKVMVEFVSANPTGPMHMGNARGGAIGDCLAAALDAAGYDVSREFYVNDAGNQIERFGASLEARYLQIYKGEDAVEFPEDGYHGEDIKERAQEFADNNGDKFLNVDPAERRKALVDYALPRNIDAQREDLFNYRIDYQTWFRESSLYQRDIVSKVLDMLTKRGLTYENEGALWYKATEFGAEKDEVLVRQNGNATYFAADIAYHYDKFAIRGFDTVINLWGADHHGHVARLKGAMDAIGLSGDALEIVLFQLVRLMKDGEPYKMSKRSGRSVTLSDLLDMVPVDVARFFFNMREPGVSIDFDLDLAVEESSKNPVYYVQYAHARICSIFAKLKSEGITPRDVTAEELKVLNSPEEIELIRTLATWPGEIIYAATRHDPARLTHYVVQVANLFHKFYTAHRVNTDDEVVMQARICLCSCARTTISNALTLMKIGAPESM